MVAITGRRLIIFPPEFPLSPFRRLAHFIHVIFRRAFLFFLLIALLPWFSTAAELETAENRTVVKRAKAFIIPVRDEISAPNLFILRRGLKQAIAEKADIVLLDMKTPGGRLDVTFEMLQALEKFPGTTATFVNDEAISAGALIAAGTDEIFFHPRGVIGAAAPVNAGGQDIDETMRAKIVSYLKARVRSVSEGHGFRGDVVSAMIDRDSELKIHGSVIKPKGELLSLTASEALATYGDPPAALLGAGISEDVAGVLEKLTGNRRTETVRMEITWSEEIAKYLAMVSPVLMGLGMMALFIEFKTPGFGFFGIAGILLLVVVFLGHHIAGLSGHEPLIAFLLGVCLIAAEVLFFPGLVFPAVIGACLVLGSLVWGMLDIWPGEMPDFSGEVIARPLANVLAALAIAVGGFMALLRFLPQTGPFSRMILHTAVGGEPVPGTPVFPATEISPSTPSASSDLVGKSGIAVTGLFPSGQVEIADARYEARLAVGHADPGTTVRVTAKSGFSLIVEVIP